MTPEPTGRPFRLPRHWPGLAYRTVLRQPGAWRFSAAAFLGRMPMSMIGLGTILLVTADTGRYGLAGTVAAAGALSSAVGAPLAARLTDRFGQRPVLVPQAIAFAVATAGFLTAAQLRWPPVALLAWAGLAGATMPSLGSMVRSRWSFLLGGGGALATAFALESIADEIIYVVGPVGVTLLATEVFPAAGLVAAGALCVAGTLLLAAQRGTEPPLAPASRHRAGRAVSALRLPTPGLVTLAPLLMFLGAAFAAMELSTVAFAAQLGHRPLAGVVLGVLALGSAVSGLWYGARTWRRPAEARFALTLAWVTAGLATFWAAPGLLALAGAMFACGLGIAPTLMTAFGLIERQAAAHRRTEALSWLSSAIGVGAAGGAAAAGSVVAAAGARAGFGFAAGCGVAACLACLAGYRRLRR